MLGLLRDRHEVLPVRVRIHPARLGLLRPELPDVHAGQPEAMPHVRVRPVPEQPGVRGLRAGVRCVLQLGDELLALLLRVRAARLRVLRRELRLVHTWVA